MRPPKILCIEDDRLIREFLVMRLEELDKKAKTTILEAGDGASGVHLARKVQPDLVILDLGLPDVHGLNIIGDLHRLSPKPRVLILTASAPENILHRIASSRVAGLLLKSEANGAELLSAVRTVLEGGTYFSKPILAAIAAARKQPMHFSKILSPREIELLPYLGFAWTNESIANRLSLSPATVRTHRQNILGKLDLHSTEKLVHWAVIKGFTDYRYEPAQEDASALNGQSAVAPPARKTARKAPVLATNLMIQISCGYVISDTLATIASATSEFLQAALIVAA